MSAEQFPLVKQAGLSLVNLGENAFPAWYVPALVLERWLEQAPVEHLVRTSLGWSTVVHGYDGVTHTAKLVCIQPIVRDTAESLLREYIKRAGDCHNPMWENVEEKQRFVERARILVGEKAK